MTRAQLLSGAAVVADDGSCGADFAYMVGKCFYRETTEAAQYNEQTSYTNRQLYIEAVAIYRSSYI